VAYHVTATRLGATASLLTLPGADHFDVIDPESRFWPEIASAILELVDA
ncbi:MAG: alpha/beta hydrolase, partial [Chloroflexia bacterium]|nr:alpha/beta hydrolase [Chloroflexia bacterium]